MVIVCQYWMDNSITKNDLCNYSDILLELTSCTRKSTKYISETQMKVIPETRRGTNIDIYVSSTIEIF
jgi:hypothetical protein